MPYRITFIKNYDIKERIQEDPCFFHLKWVASHRLVWEVNDNECLVQTQYHLLDITFLRTDRTFIIDRLITIALNQWVFEPEQVFPRTLSRDDFVLPPPAELFGFPLYPTISVYKFPRQPSQELTPAPPSPIYVADSPIYVPDSPTTRNPTYSPTISHSTSPEPPVDLPWRIIPRGSLYFIHINRYYAEALWEHNQQTGEFGWSYRAKNNRRVFPLESVLSSTDLSKPLPELAKPIPAHDEDQKDTNNPAGSSTDPNMTTTVTEIKTKVKEGKKPAGVPPRGETPRPDSPDDSDPGSDPPPNDPNDDANSNSFRSTTTNAFSELKERGIKPEHFKGNRDKTDRFCYDFGRYLCFNIAFYPKQSERVDLFLSSIDHPWADACSLELENDRWDDSIPQNKK
ncbi:hypothetical protein PM082_024423 [Marasmius tenuissimus]|nr:hypothetical protein PM082_024423 [Marasmius tenuissimus]